MNTALQQAQRNMLANLPRQHGFEPAHIEGELPPWVNGTLYRNGPGLSSRFGQRIAHAFDGDGAITAVRVRSGQASTATRLIETRAFKEEEARQQLLYGFQTPWWRRMVNGVRGKTKTPANVNVLFWQGKLYALPEGAQPIEIDANTLETLDEEVFDQLGKGYHSAHPHIVPERKCAYGYRILWGKTSTLSVLAWPEQGTARELIQIPLDNVPYFHDFVATPTHLFFMVPPVNINIFRAMLQIGPMTRIFDWNPQQGTQIIVVPLDAPDEYRRFDTEPFFLWHFAHASVTNQRAELVYSRWRDFSVMAAIGDPDIALDDAPYLTATTIDFQSGEVEHRRLCDVPGEFPQRGADSTLYMLSESKDYSGVIAYKDGQHSVYQFDAGQIASEPLWMPHEDGGLVATLVYDDAWRRSYMAFLDARDIQRGPVAKVWFEHHVPMTFHGAWVPDY